MLKYASKFFLNIFLSVLATVIGSYLANQYIVGRPVVEVPVSLDATIDPQRPDANSASREAGKGSASRATVPGNRSTAVRLGTLYRITGTSEASAAALKCL